MRWIAFPKCSSVLVGLRFARRYSAVLRPSLFAIPFIAVRAARSLMDLWWITTSIDPHFDEKEFLSNAVDAYSVVVGLYKLHPVFSLPMS
jgi:hypothetical protein